MQTKLEVVSFQFQSYGKVICFYENISDRNSWTILMPSAVYAKEVGGFKVKKILYTMEGFMSTSDFQFGNFLFWQFNNLAIFNFGNFGNFQFWQLSILAAFNFGSFQFWQLSILANSFHQFHFINFI